MNAQTPELPLRLIVEPKRQSGSLNMAIDETLLESAIERKVATLRIYQWDRPTVSLGYFQSADDPIFKTRFFGLPRVRRLSGGGALLHHSEITYSIAFPAEHRYGENPTELYNAVHDSIVAYLNEHGAPAALRGTALAEEPFLCFGRGDARDIVLGASKIVGSAQRRRRGAVLQHGALLLTSSRHAPEFRGLFNLTPGLLWDQVRLRRELGPRIAADVSGAFEAGTLLEAEAMRAAELEQSRYATLQNEPRRMPDRYRPAQ